MYQLFDQYTIVFVDDDGVNTWPEVLKFLFEMASSQNISWKENSLLILRLIPYASIK